MLSLYHLVDSKKCYETVRQLRWGDEGVKCPHCQHPETIKQGKDEKQPERQRYQCKGCKQKFDDLTGTVFAGHHQPLEKWVSCLYLMGLNLSNRQIAHELELDESDAQQMTRCLRQGVVDLSVPSSLSGIVEIDEVYIVSGHKGQSAEVKKRT